MIINSFVLSDKFTFLVPRSNTSMFGLLGNPIIARDNIMLVSIGDTIIVVSMDGTSIFVLLGDSIISSVTTVSFLFGDTVLNIYMIFSIIFHSIKILLLYTYFSFAKI
ncbi:hypothetical protein AAHE18_13G170300 [Arachis hypogaea]